MRTLLKDLQFGWRLLAKRPAFTVTAVLALGLGIGANTAIFSLLDRVVLRPLPYPEPERLVTLWETKLVDGLDHEQMSPVNFLDYRNLSEVFEDAAAWWTPQINLTDEEKEPIRVNTIEVSSNFFAVLGTQPLLGQGFPPSEELFAAERIAVISHRLWQSRYGKDPAILGRTLQMNERPYVIVGVMPPGFNFPGRTDIWQRLNWDMSRHSRFAHFMESVARLKPGVTVERANSRVAAAAAGLAEEFPQSNKDWGVRVVPLHGEIIGVFHEGLLILFGAVGLLLFLACANVANMLLSRAAARQREVAVRAAMGAGRGRLIRQLLTESLLLGTLGAVFGLLLAALCLKVFTASSLIEIPRLEAVAVDFRVLAFAAMAAFLTTALFGLIPALQLSGADLQPLLKEGGRSAMTGRAGRRLRSALVVGEVALSIVLLVGTGLLIRSFAELTGENPGFDPAGKLTLNLELPAPRQRADWPQIGQFYEQLLAGLQDHAQVEAAAAINFLPPANGWRVNFVIKGRPPLPANELPIAQYLTATPNYFSTMGIPLLKGRDFDGRDTAESPGVAIINSELARRHWPDENPVGDFIVENAGGFGPLGRALKPGSEFEIVGVVSDVKNNTLRKEAEPAIYFVNSQFPYKNMNLVLKGRGSPAAFTSLVGDQVRRIDPKVPVEDARPLGAVFYEATAQPRFIMLLMSAFGALALLLAGVGVYGVLSYAVAERTHEIGIRMVLGAEPGRVRRLVVSQGLGLAALGVALGTAAAWAVSRVVSFSTLLYKVEPGDATSFAAALAVMLTVSVVACYAPAARASRVDPQKALRVE